MRILSSLSADSGADVYAFDPTNNGSCTDWVNCTILQASGVTPNPSGSYSEQANDVTTTTGYQGGPALDASGLLPGDQIHFNNPYYDPTNPFDRLPENRLENGCNTFVVGKDSSGNLLLFNRWVHPDGHGGFADGPGVMTMQQYRDWMATWPTVTNKHVTDPKFPIDRIRKIK